MLCYHCGCHLSEHDFCTACGADVSLYKKIMHVSNMFYNDGLEKAGVRDLSGAINSLRQSLKFNKNNIEARNLLGLVYFEMGEVVAALSEWVISKNLRPDKNIADTYIGMVQSNATRLDTINQTIKKYNQALVYCKQDSKDLAMIQLKKVLSLNPKFIRAHLLLAVLYLDSEQWERAQRELKRCLDIDCNNTQTLRYMQEVERMLTMDDAGKHAGRAKKEDTVRYRSDNEIIIQPVNVKEAKRSGGATLLNILIGLVIGLAAMYFLGVPAAESAAKSEAQKSIVEIGNQLDVKTATIQELELELENLRKQNDSLNGELEGFMGADGTMQTMDLLLKAASDYLETGDEKQTAESLEAISQKIQVEDASETFKRLYQALLDAVAPKLAQEYYSVGFEAYRNSDYPTAIENLEKVTTLDEKNGDALYYLGQAYRKNNDKENAISTYDRVMELFPGTEWATKAKQYKDGLTN